MGLVQIIKDKYYRWEILTGVYHFTLTEKIIIQGIFLACCLMLFSRILWFLGIYETPTLIEWIIMVKSLLFG